MNISLTNNKFLIIFDFDDTLIDQTTFTNLFKKYYSPQQIKDLFSKIKNNISWIELYRDCIKELKRQNLNINDIKKEIEQIKLIEGYQEVFNTIRNNMDKFICVIISGGNQLMIKWLTDLYNISDLIYKVFAVNSFEDEDHIIKFKDINKHNCDNCNITQCKKNDLELLIDEFKLKEKGMKESNADNSGNVSNKGNESNKENKEYKENTNWFSKILYVGDGINDYCPAKILKKTDYLYFRKGYGLNKLIDSHEKYKNKLVCNINYWENGHDVNNYLLSFVLKPKF